PHALLRGRVLRPVHPLPQRHREGSEADARREMGRAAAGGAVAGHARRLDLRPRPGGAQPPDIDPEVLPGGTEIMVAVPKQEVVRFTLDGQEIEALAGETIWQAAARYGTKIPHLCYSPEPGYRADGNCRACMVEIE